MELLEKAIKGEEKRMATGKLKLTIDIGYNWNLEEKREDQKIFVFNASIKGHDEKHTINLAPLPAYHRETSSEIEKRSA